MQNGKPDDFAFPVVLSGLFQALGVVLIAIAASIETVPKGQFGFGLSTLMFGTFLGAFATNVRAWLPAPLLALVAFALIGGLAACFAESFARLPASMAIPARWTLVAGGVGMLAATIAGWVMHDRIPPR